MTDDSPGAMARWRESRGILPIRLSWRTSLDNRAIALSLRGKPDTLIPTVGPDSLEPFFLQADAEGSAR